MARPPRIDFANAVYQVTSRGSGRAKVSWSDADPLRLLCTVPIDEIDAAVAGRYRIDRQELQTHGLHAGSAKVVAVEFWPAASRASRSEPLGGTTGAWGC